MLLDHAHAEGVFRKIKSVQDEIRAYELAPDRADLPIDAFQRAVESMYKLSIEMYLVPFEATFVRGLLERYENKAIIYIRKNMAFEWIRFTAVKELCHVVVDEPDDWTTDGIQTIENLIYDYFYNKDELAERTTHSEVLAEIAAIELLYPFEYRELDRRNLDSGETTLAKIAGHFKVPQYVIGRALSRSHSAIAETIWTQIEPTQTIGEASGL